MLTRVLSGFQLGIAHNLLTDQVKIGVFDTRLVQELSPFLWFLFFAIGLLLGIYFGIIRKAKQVYVCQDKVIQPPQTEDMIKWTKRCCLRQSAL